MSAGKSFSERGGKLSGGHYSVNSSIKLGTYARRLANLNLAGKINPIPNLTTVYLDTPLVFPTPEPLEYVSSLGRRGQPIRYPPPSTVTSIGVSRSRPPPPPPPIIRTYRCIPQLVRRNRAGCCRQRAQVKMQNFWLHGANPWRFFGPSVWRGLSSPRTRTRTGEGQGSDWCYEPTCNGPRKIHNLETRGEPLAKF